VHQYTSISEWSYSIVFVQKLLLKIINWASSPALKSFNENGRTF
jgi:hypothetical protein